MEQHKHNITIHTRNSHILYNDDRVHPLITVIWRSTHKLTSAIGLTLWKSASAHAHVSTCVRVRVRACAVASHYMQFTAARGTLREASDVASAGCACTRTSWRPRRWQVPWGRAGTCSRHCGERPILHGSNRSSLPVKTLRVVATALS